MDITPLTRRFSRQALSRPNFAYFVWRYLANGVRTGRAMLMRPAHAGTSALGEELKAQGIVVGPSATFLTSQGQEILHDVGGRILRVSRDSLDAVAPPDDAARRKEFLVHLASYPDGMPADDALLRLALDPKLLEIVSTYFGLWPCLHSIGAWLNYPTPAPPQLSQLWHRDPEDLQLVKVFIYLTDVGEQSGPFTYIPGTHPFGPRNPSAQKFEQKKRVVDKGMARVFPPDSWRVCTGPAHTMILADTVGYHRGGKPLVGQRILITFTYTSQAPITSRTLWVRDTPTWTTSAIQRFAVRSLLERPAAAPKKKKRAT